MPVRTLIVAAVSILLVTGSAAGAGAGWVARGQGAGVLAAASMSTPLAPTVVQSASAVSVSWPEASLDQGKPANGYLVRRHVGGTTTTVCTTVAPILSCTDSAPAAGTVTYGVVATFEGWLSPESLTTGFTLDTTAPTTSASASGTPNAAGWIRSPISTVTVGATDTESGVASVSYRVGSGSWVTVSGSSTSLAVSTQGITTVTFNATDNAGNTATSKTLTVKLDNVEGTVTTTYPSSGAVNAAAWNGNCRNSSNAVSNGLCGLSADATSGVVTAEYELRRTPLGGGTTTCWNSNSQKWTMGICGTYRAAGQGPSGISSWYVPLASVSLGTGNFELRIRVTDAAGNLNSVVNPTQAFSVVT